MQLLSIHFELLYGMWVVWSGGGGGMVRSGGGRGEEWELVRNGG